MKISILMTRLPRLPTTTRHDKHVNVVLHNVPIILKIHRSSKGQTLYFPLFLRFTLP